MAGSHRVTFSHRFLQAPKPVNSLKLHVYRASSKSSFVSAVFFLTQRTAQVLGVTSPFFPGVLLSRKPPNTWGNGWFLTRKMAAKNGESTPRSVSDAPLHTKLRVAGWGKGLNSQEAKNQLPSNWWFGLVGPHLPCTKARGANLQRTNPNNRLKNT